MPAASGITGAGNLSVSPGSWTNSPTSFAYQWQDCNGAGASCTNATGAGATSSSYTVGVNDTTGTIRAVVSAHNPSGAGTSNVYTGPAPALWGANQPGGPSGSASAGELKDASLFRLQILNPGTSSQLDAYHADNPNQVLFQYHGGNSTESNPTSDFVGSPCKDENVAATQASGHAGDPQFDWFLYYPSGFPAGNRMFAFNSNANGGSNEYVMDPGNTFYQSCLATALINRAGNYHFTSGHHDGLYTDNVPLVGETKLNTTLTIPGYPFFGAATGTINNSTDYFNAYNSLMAALTARAHAAGLLTLGNIALGAFHLSQYDTSVLNFDGSHEQSFNPIALGSAQDSQDVSTLTEQAYSEAHSKWYLAGYNFNPGATESRITFILSEFLMAANGYSMLDLDPENNAVPTFFRAMTDAMQLGPAISPSDQARSIGGTVYERDFKNGVAVFNPSQSATSSFSPTPGGVYSGRECNAVANTCSTLTNVSSVTLGADGGAVLLRTG